MPAQFEEIILHVPITIRNSLYHFGLVVDTFYDGCVDFVATMRRYSIEMVIE
jgi:hypothetical protein